MDTATKGYTIASSIALVDFAQLALHSSGTVSLIGYLHEGSHR